MLLVVGECGNAPLSQASPRLLERSQAVFVPSLMETKLYLIAQLWSQQFNILLNWNIEIKIYK